MKLCRCLLAVVVFLSLAALAAAPASAAPEPASCAALPWEAPSATAAASPAVNPLQPSPLQMIWDTSCTTSSQCPTGQVCQCSMCHAACPTNYRWNCICQVCYKCPSGTFFDPDLCACSAI